MIAQFLFDYSKRRKNLHPALQTHVDELVRQMQEMARTMCELPVAHQHIVVDIESDTQLLFALDNKSKSLHIMFLD